MAKQKAKSETGQKDRGGRPPKYEDPVVFHDTVIKYFDSCEKSKTLPNKAGLCVFLNISRDTYNEYKKRFPDTLKATEDYIENSWVQRLAGNSPTGAIFYLKNAFKEHYKDKHETDVTSGGKPLQTIVGMTIQKDAGSPTIVQNT